MASLAVTYLVAELVLFRFLLPNLSLNLVSHLPDRAGILAQSSKRSYVPQDYLLLAGDSYAQGIGDWLLSVEGRADLPHHSAHVLRERLGRDVASVGRFASNSAEALIYRVSRVFDDPSCYLFPALQPPRHILVYFYEGNDLEENLRMLEREIRPPKGADVVGEIDRYTERNFANISHWRCHAHLADFLLRITRFVFRRDSGANVLDPPNRPNQLVIGESVIDAPLLQTPAMALSNREIEHAVLVYDRALRWLRGRFPEVPVTVVYIPGPASVYRYTSAGMYSLGAYVPLSDPESGRIAQRWGVHVPVSEVYRRSQVTCEKIRESSVLRGAAFLDARPEIRKAAAGNILHGPRDWHHFNERGYRQLGRVIADRLHSEPKDGCDDSWPPHPLGRQSE